MRLSESFFARDTREVAKDLLGKYLVRKLFENELERVENLRRETYNKKKKFKDKIPIGENLYIVGSFYITFKGYEIPIFITEDVIKKEKYCLLIGKIIATEAYKGMGKRDKKGILYPPGYIYLYPLRGGYNFNISTEAENIPACVLIAEIMIGENRIGQLNLVKLFSISQNFEGKSIEKNEFLWIDNGIVEEERKEEVVKNRVGIYRLWLL